MQETKSQKAKFNLDVSEITGIKLVKNSSVFAKDGFVYAVHYGKVIFQYDMNHKKKTIVDLDCSATSNRLIYRCLDFYGVRKEDCENIHDGEKWNYSGSFY